MPLKAKWVTQANRQTENQRNDSEEFLKARQAAEALFKPQTQAAPTEGVRR